MMAVSKQQRPLGICGAPVMVVNLRIGEFVSNPELMEKGLRNAPQDWRNKNIELVLQTKITDLTAGPPEVVAAFYW